MYSDMPQAFEVELSGPLSQGLQQIEPPSRQKPWVVGFKMWEDGSKSPQKIRSWLKKYKKREDGSKVGIG